MRVVLLPLHFLPRCVFLFTKMSSGDLVPSMDLPRCSCLFFSFFIFLLVVPETTLAASPYLGGTYLTCMHNTTNGTSLSSTFKHNLNTALQNLTNLSSNGTKYSITSAGSGDDDMVYAMFQCRGDQTTQLCWECVANATARLPQRECPASIGARIQLDGCYLRYDNESFFTLDVSNAFAYCDGTTSDPVILSTIYSLVQNVTTKAPEQGGFAYASGDGEYAAAQCLGYLNESECSACLLNDPYRIWCDSSLGEMVHLTSCYYRFEPYSFLAPLSPFIAPAHTPALANAPMSPPGFAPPPTQNESHTGSKTPIIAAGVSVAAIIALVALCVILVWRNKASSKKRGAKQVERQASWPQSLLVRTKAKVFSLQELEDATRHFHPDNKLGEGGYGSVYKGTLSNGEQVAIKKLAVGSRQGNQEFLNEVSLITSVQHKNLIQLLGSCVEGSERILVYEYLPNKSLDFMLFEQRDGKILDWPTRYGIILGMAKGLAYLHEGSHIQIIHRDIKPSNILLDSHLNPVIADFGLARLVQSDATHINTRVAGTIGYLAPEYAMHGELSIKADVFSFGLVSLEILSGKKNFNNEILEWAWRLYVQENTLDLIDTKLGHAFSHEQVIRVVHVALLCTQENPKQRPTMFAVLLFLSGKSKILEIPHKPAFVDSNELRVHVGTNHQWSSTCFDSSTTKHSAMMSNAAYSISENIDPR